MLQAKTKNGIPVTLAMLTKTEINQLRKNNILFYCPVCNQEVIMKAGIKTIAHFAHRSAIKCPSGEGGEGLYHENGKLLLFQWLKSQGIPVQLETYLPDIKQRPDLLVSIRKKKIAIEFQCASISVDEVKRRNAGYKQIGITPIWIIGGNRLKRSSANHFKLNRFLHPFIHQFSLSANPTLFFFSTDTLQFIKIQDIYLTGTSQAMGNFFIERLNRLCFIDIFKEHTFTTKKAYILWQKEKYKLRVKQSSRLYGQELAWHQWLYLKGLHRETLPAIIYLPVTAQFKMKTAPWNWQSRLVLDMIAPLPLGKTFSLKRSNHLLRSHIYSADNFPLIHSDINPIREYLQLLSHLNIIHQTSSDIFMKTKPIHKPETVEQAIKEDKQVLRTLVKQNRSMIPY